MKNIDISKSIAEAWEKGTRHINRAAKWIVDGGLNFFQPATEAPEEWEMEDFGRDIPKAESAYKPRQDFKGKVGGSTSEPVVPTGFLYSFDLIEYAKSKYGEEMTVEGFRKILSKVTIGEWNRQHATIGEQRTRDRKADYRKVKSQRAKYRRLGASKRARMRGVKK